MVLRIFFFTGRTNTAGLARPDQHGRTPAGEYRVKTLMHFPLDSKKSDGYNFLDRYERLTLANKIYSRLLQIKYKMEAMAMTCQFCNGISEVLFAIDPESWAAYFTGKNVVEGLVNDWNNLGV